MNVLYILGVPGVGKTTMVRRLLKNNAVTQKQEPYIYISEYSGKAAQLGWDREHFGGTDSLGMAAQKHVLAWIAKKPYKYLLGEGDRLANAKFFDALREMGVELTVAALVADPEAVELRRKKRNEAIGKPQNEQWLRTRETKVTNLTAGYVEDEWVLPVNNKEERMAARMKLAGHVVIRACRGS